MLWVGLIVLIAIALMIVGKELKKFLIEIIGGVSLLAVGGAIGATIGKTEGTDGAIIGEIIGIVLAIKVTKIIDDVWMDKIKQYSKGKAIVIISAGFPVCMGVMMGNGIQVMIALEASAEVGIIELAVIGVMGAIMGATMGVIMPIGEGLLFELSDKSEPKSPVKPKEHLIMQFLHKKNKESYIAYISLCVAFAGECILYKTAQMPETSVRWMMILTAFLLLLSFINQRILKYRVDHGLYGTSYSEAKEIVAFILELQRKNGNSNSKPPKLVFTQEEIDECLQVNGGEEYAG